MPVANINPNPTASARDSRAFIAIILSREVVRKRHPSNARLAVTVHLCVELRGLPSAVSGQRSAVSGQRSAISKGMRKPEVRNFRDLKVWEKSHRLTLAVYKE